MTCLKVRFMLNDNCNIILKKQNLIKVMIQRTKIYKTMKITSIIFLFLFFNVSQSIAQSEEWANVGTKWWYTTEYCEKENCGYYTFESIKDTLVLGKNAKYIETKTFGTVSPSNPYNNFIMYGEEGRVFQYDTINNDFLYFMIST